jgi:hypothetical protein
VSADRSVGVLLSIYFTSFVTVKVDGTDNKGDGNHLLFTFLALHDAAVPQFWPYSGEEN